MSSGTVLCSHWRRRDANKPNRVMVFVSSGDADDIYKDIANEIASEMKEKLEDVYFTGWTTQTDIEELSNKLDRCHVALLISSPYGKKTYQEFLELKEISTWKDLFVLAAFRIFQTKGCYPTKLKTIVAYYASDPVDADAHLHKDFVSSDGKCYNLATVSGYNSLCAAVLNGPIVQNYSREFVHTRSDSVTV